MMIEDFGAHVASIWAGLRPHTRKLVESAWQSATSNSSSSLGRGVAAIPYDSRAERELSGLLTALDERAAEAGAALSAEQNRELRRMADTCAVVLQSQAQSAEAFALLIERSLQSRDYAWVDTLADAVLARLAPSEICELARHPNAAVRAIAQEALTQVSTSTLVDLLGDQVDSGIARAALERQATEYGSDEARWIVNALYRTDADEEDA